MFNNQSKIYRIAWRFNFVLIALSLCFALIRGNFVHSEVALKSVEKLGFTSAKIVEEDRFLPGYHSSCDGYAAARFRISAIDLQNAPKIIDVCVGYPKETATIPIN